MTCGVPLVVTPVAGLKEQVVHLQTAIFAEEVSSDSVARAIDSLVKDISLYEKISKKCSTIRSGRDGMGKSRISFCGSSYLNYS
ncbi:glycosyltransferase [Escherichia coli]